MDNSVIINDRRLIRTQETVSAIIRFVDYQIAGHQTDGWQISTEVYSGPLDLLLQLIENAELDITSLALSQVTDQYLEYMHHLQEQDAAEVSAFLVIAAKLVQIKSAALLPKSPVPSIQPEEDPGEALARQLILYKRFKDLSRVLEYREEHGLHTFLRLDSDPKAQMPTRLDLTGFTLADLVQAAREIFTSPHNLAPLSQVVSFPRITIRQRITSILDHLRRSGSTPFHNFILNRGDRVEIVVTFLAMLELVKRHMVTAVQEATFSEITLQSEGDIIGLDDQDLEFSD